MEKAAANTNIQSQDQRDVDQQQDNDEDKDDRMPTYSTKAEDGKPPASKKEEEEATESGVEGQIIPRERDIIFRQCNRPANVALNELLEKVCEEHTNAAGKGKGSTKEQERIRKRICKQYRFLKKEKDGTYFLVDDKTLRVHFNKIMSKLRKQLGLASSSDSSTTEDATKSSTSTAAKSSLSSPNKDVMTTKRGER